VKLLSWVVVAIADQEAGSSLRMRDEATDVPKRAWAGNIHDFNRLAPDSGVAPGLDP